MKKDVSKKSKIILVAIVFSLLLIVVGAFLVLNFFLSGENDKENGQNIQYYLADYEEDIFQNKAYMEFQRDLSYSYAGVEQFFSNDDFEDASTECKFFLSYFDAVTKGDYEKYPAFFVDGYFEKNPMFTMQMIYEPFVKYHSASTETIDEKEVVLLNFQVRYKIFKNNGTFRSGVPSNSAIPQIYQLIKSDDGSYKIFRILDIEEEK